MKTNGEKLAAILRVANQLAVIDEKWWKPNGWFNG
jgi:hypothetical protein